MFSRTSYAGSSSFPRRPKPSVEQRAHHAFSTGVKDLWPRRSEASRPKNAPALFEVKVLRNGRRSPRVTKGFYHDR